MSGIIYKKATGLQLKRGRPSSECTPSKSDLLRLYVKKGKSIREVAEALGCSKDMAARAMKTYGIEARANAKRSRLRECSLKELESGVKRCGIRGFARELGIDESTLRHHLNVREAD